MFSWVEREKSFITAAPGLFLLSFITEIPVLNANSVDPDQTPRSVASDLGLRYLPFMGCQT